MQERIQSSADLSRAVDVEARDELAVRRREVVGGQLFGLDPRHRLALARLDGARLLAAVVEVEHDGAVGILPPHRLHELAHGEGGAELLGQLASQRTLRRLASLQLAARKLPEAGQMAARAALGDQIAAGLVPDERGGDLDDEWHGSTTGRGRGRRRAWGTSRRSRASGSARSAAGAAYTTWRRSP